MKQVVSFVLVVFLFSAVAPPVSAKVWINEFSSDNGTDWVELYNDSDTEVVPLTTYELRDSSASGNKLTLSGILSPHGYSTFDWGQSLNKTGDGIHLIDTITGTEVDKVVYGVLEEAVIGAPLNGQFGARKTDAGGEFALFTSDTKGSSNSTATPAPTATPEPSSTPKPTPTPTRAPTPTKIPTPTKSPTSTKNPPVTQTSATVKSGNTVSRPSPTPDRNIPTAVLAAKTEKAWPTIVPTTPVKEVKTLGVSTVNPSVFIIAAGVVMLLGGIGYGYYRYRKNP